ncbi:MAG: hypothetical protein WCK89_14775, partial [bacterium]
EAEKLRDQINVLIEQKRTEPLRKKMEQVSHLHYSILFEQPGWWVGYFKYLIGVKDKMKDQESAAQLFNQGRLCIDKGNVQGLRSVVLQILDLLPETVREEIQKGYGSDLSK